METPKTNAGRITERIMFKVREKLPEIETHEYNRTYEAVLAVLKEECIDAPQESFISLEEYIKSL